MNSIAPYSIAELMIDLSLAQQLKAGMVLDRKQTNQLRNQLSNLDSTATGCAVMLAQLNSVLARKDWSLIHIFGESPEEIRRVGVHIGIAEGRSSAPRLSKMQQEQNRLFRGRKQH